MELDEETALAILFRNLKGPKKKDYLATANACRFLTQLYRSHRKVAEKAGVSSEIIREFDSLNDLPEAVKKLVSKGSIKLDIGSRISTQIESEKRKVEIARAVADMRTFDARAVIEYAKKNLNTPASEVKSRVLRSKTVTEKVHIFVMPLPHDIFQKLKTESNRLKIRPEELVKKILQEWLKEKTSAASGSHTLPS